MRGNQESRRLLRKFLDASKPRGWTDWQLSPPRDKGGQGEQPYICSATDLDTGFGVETSRVDVDKSHRPKPNSVPRSKTTILPGYISMELYHQQFSYQSNTRRLGLGLHIVSRRCFVTPRNTSHRKNPVDSVDAIYSTHTWWEDRRLAYNMCRVRDRVVQILTRDSITRPVSPCLSV